MGRILQTMKMEHYSNYSAQDTARSESALLSVWATLKDLTDDLVLVGGLVPRYICKSPEGAMHPVTMDVDLGISLAMSTGQYETTKNRLQKAGFMWEGKRFVKAISKTTLFLDFLTDKPAADAPDTAMVDDIPVSAVLGVERALETYRVVNVSGTDLYGANVCEQIKVCEAGPFLCLKLQAYHNRAQSKDVFDIVRTVRDYDGGTVAAAIAFRSESDKNLAFDCANHALETRFSDPSAKGPVQYADFCTGGLLAESAADTTFLMQQYANEAVDAARALLV
jgi:hypothetical protein